MDDFAKLKRAIAILRDMDNLIDFKSPVAPETPFEFLDTTEINKVFARAVEALVDEE